MGPAFPEGSDQLELSGTYYLLGEAPSLPQSPPLPITHPGCDFTHPFAAVPWAITVGALAAEVKSSC